MFTIRLVHTVFMVENRYKYIENLSRDYFSNEAPDVVLHITAEDIYREKEIDGIVEFSDDYYESLVLHRKVCEYLLQHNVLPFHASALSLDGEAYLFAAPSGTGKSTHAGLWRERFGHRVTMINDDKPFLSLEDGIWRAYGSPWCGKEGLHTNTSAPIKKIILLEQANENRISRLDTATAVVKLMKQTYLSDDFAHRMQILQLVGKLCELPVFKLSCTISQEAVEKVIEIKA